jgi:hypothetical protein
MLEVGATGIKQPTNLLLNSHVEIQLVVSDV